MINESSIRMINIDQLAHHPQNPRTDLGDLTELSDSIKAKGIMQNLTVVLDTSYDPEPDNPVRHRYYVVIGNRRLEASKMAGLKELPCAVVQMDKQEIMATMLAENMQRQDLTVYEQAQGFQLMMDLGFDESQIAERTGVSKSTVRRRLKMAELDKDALRKACEAKDTERQIALSDFEKLSQVESIKKRNELLLMIGSRDFDWNLNAALRKQQIDAVLPKVKEAIKASGLKSIKREERWGNKYDRLQKATVYLASWDGQTPLIPKSKETLYYFLDDTELEFYTKAKKPEPVQKTEEEKAEEKRIADAWKKIKEDSELAKQLRKNFADGMHVTAKDAEKLLRWALKGAAMATVGYCSNSSDLQGLLGTERHSMPEIQDGIAVLINGMALKDLPKVIRCFFDGQYSDSYVNGFQRDMPAHKANRLLDTYYAWLTDFGYQMSDTEIALKDGTHECFGKASQ